MKLKINNGPEFDVGTKAGLMRASIEQLKGYRKTTLNPEELDRDISIMEWILAQKTPEEMATVFYERRMAGNSGPRDRALVMRELGWEWRK